MSMIRKTVVATAIIGAGLGSMSGAALAHESASSGSGCSNAVEALTENGAGETEGDTTGGDQEFGLSNECDFLNGNSVGNDSNVATGASTIRNGDNVTETSETTTTETSDETTVEDGGAGALPGAGAIPGLDVLTGLFGGILG